MDGVVFVINSFGIVEVEDRFGFDFLAMDVCCRPCSLGYKPYCFSEGTVFFSHNKSANSTFSHGFSSEQGLYPKAPEGGYLVKQWLDRLWCRGVEQMARWLIIVQN